MINLRSKNILEYRDSIFELQYLLDKEQKDIQTVPFELFLRPFQFYSDSFEDVEYAGTSCMPIFIAFTLASGNKKEDKYTVSLTKKTIATLADYLDGHNLVIKEKEDPAQTLHVPYEFEEKVSVYKNILQINPMIVQKEKELRELNDPQLTTLLDKSVDERIKHYGDVIMAITTSKNCIYNIVRSFGNVLIEKIKDNIESMIPANQNFFLHGLDAFPHDQKVIDFLKGFIAKHKGQWIAEEAQKYLERVETGTKTTGWE